MAKKSSKKSSEKESFKIPLNLIRKQKKIPEGIYLLAALFFLVSLSFLSISFQVFVNTDNPTRNLGGTFETLSQTNSWYNELTFLTIGIVLFVVSLVFYLIGRGLLRFDNRARITALIVLSLTAVLFLSLMFMDTSDAGQRFFYSAIFLILIQGAGIWYLTRKDIAEKFS